MKKLILALACLLTLAIPAQAQSGTFIVPNSSVIASPVTGQTWLFNSTLYTVSVWTGSSYRVVNTPFGNFAATMNPTVSNDGTQGYVVGSFWLNQSTQGLFICASNATGAAVWTGVNAVVTTIPLPDLEQGGATNGQSLLWNNGLSQWAPGSPAILLAQLLQSGATTGQVPAWSGSAWVASNAGAGTVTTFSAGNLSPFFTTSVSNATTTPALSFALSNAVSKGILSNPSGSAAGPGYNVLTLTAGAGLSGGGNLADSPTVSLSTPVSVANGGTGAATFLAHQWLGNNTGSTAPPAPASILATDLPSTTVNTVSNSATALTVNISGQNLGVAYSGTALPIANGGTNATTATSAFNNLLVGTATTGQIPEYNGTNWVPVTVSGTGTVTSVAMTGDGTIFNSSVSGSPITTSGTLAPALLTQTARTVLAGPTSGGAALPVFRFLVAGDLPASTVNSVGNLNPLFNSSVSSQALTFTQQSAAANSIFCNNTGGSLAPSFNVLNVVAGTGLSGGGAVTTSPTINLAVPVVIANGGSGLTATPTDGQFLIGNSNTNAYVLSTLTPGAGISVTNGHGTSTVSLNTPVAVANGGTGTTLFTSGSSTFLAAGSIAVVDTTITSSSIVVVTQTGTIPAAEYFSVQVAAGTGFTIYSSNGTSIATVNWIRVK